MGQEWTMGCGKSCSAGEVRAHPGVFPGLFTRSRGQARSAPTTASRAMHVRQSEVRRTDVADIRRALDAQRMSPADWVQSWIWFCTSAEHAPAPAGQCGPGPTVLLP